MKGSLVTTHQNYICRLIKDSLNSAALQIQTGAATDALGVAIDSASSVAFQSGMFRYTNFKQIFGFLR